jgi:hypothetical protein
MLLAGTQNSISGVKMRGIIVGADGSGRALRWAMLEAVRHHPPFIHPVT